MTTNEKDKLWKIFLKLRFGEVVDVDKATGVEMYSRKGIELTKKEYDFIEPFLRAGCEYKYTVGDVEIKTNEVSLICGTTQYGDRVFVEFPFEADKHCAITSIMKLEDIIRSATLEIKAIPYKNYLGNAKER